MLTPSPEAVAAYDVDVTPAQAVPVRELLKRDGFAPVGAPGDMAGGVGLLRRHLADVPAGQDELASRLQRYAFRPHPYLPTGCTVRTEYAWIDPARILLGREGLDAFHHDNSDLHRQRIRDEISLTEYHKTNAVVAMPQFARRLAAERGHPQGLAELFGLPGSDARLTVGGWWTPAGAVFRVAENGNHRTAAMAMLEAPCVLARIDWYGPAFIARFEHALAEVEDVLAWTEFLRTFQVVAGTGQLDHEQSHQGAGLEHPAHVGPFTTRWPVLLGGPNTARRSLAALDALTGSPYTGGIGVLPRSMFDSPRRARAAMRRLYRTTQDIRTTAAPRPPKFQALWRSFAR